MNRLCQRWMLDHRLHPQTLNANRLVLTNDASRELVQEVGASVGDVGMDAGHLPAGFGAIAGSLLLLRQPPLRFGEALFLLTEEVRIAHLLASVQDHHI